MPFRFGRYEIRYIVGDYFRKNGAAVSDPAYLDFVPMRISVDDAEGHYHLPVIFALWTYSTYRGT